MRKIYFTVVLAAAAYACAAQQPNARGSDQLAPPERQMPMRDMQGMQDRMLEMRALMGRIHDASDPAERRRLMDEHMRVMQEGMAMMGNMMGGRVGPQPGAACAASDTRCEMQRMQGEQQAMQQRMGMMHGMMGQMMEHMTATPSEP
ncbi:MAG TPA: hypothetical protein VKA43_09815 [Gammaproteobacteria bacterium]|nr:hypothetical protein [Gammaproteobacteria bacterium]